jgi:predicted membrane protein (TIGR00267 family)
MNRITDARNGYLNRNIEVSKRAHTRHTIHTSIFHSEKHRIDFNLPDIILGGQDGLVNVLGVILGVTAATFSSPIVLAAGLAATFAESISMAAVAYTSKLAEADYYQSEYEREKWEIENIPDGEREEIKQLYASYGFKGEMLDRIVNNLTADKEIWLKVMMEQELKLTPISRQDALPASFTVGISALAGSFIPLVPYFFLEIKEATILALILSSLTLFTVGYFKAKQTLGRKFVRSGAEMLVIGMVSAFVGYLVGLVMKV